MVLHLEPNRCEIRDLPAPSSNNNQDKIGDVSLKKKKKHQHLRTKEDGGDHDQEEHSRKKKVKKNNSETEADSDDDSCFVALVTASNLHQDAWYLPKDFSSSNGLERRCREILLTDGGEGLWALDMKFDNSCDTFYISRGWRSFCDENRKKAGGFFVFKLMGKGEMPLLSFCPAERDKASKKESLPVEPNSGKKISKDLTPPSGNRFVTLAITQGLEKSRRYLPLAFMRENGMDKPGVITMLGKDGRKWLVSLRLEAKQMTLGKGWRNFAIANGLKTGDSFTLESIWENGTPILRLFSIETTSSTRQQGKYCSEATSDIEHVSTKPDKTMKAKNSREEMREPSSAIENRYVTLTFTQDSFKKSRRYLPFAFTAENGIDKPGVITLLGKDGTKWLVNLLLEGKKQMVLGKGWRKFAIANGLKTGDSFTLESIWENGTPMLSLVNTDSTNSTRQQGEYCLKEDVSSKPNSENETKKAKNSREEMRESSSAIENHRFVTLTLTLEDVRDCVLILPSEFMKANGINKLGKITLLGKNNMKWFAYLLSKDGIMAVGCDWKEFCEANGVKIGESFTLEYINEQDATPVLEFGPKL